MKVICKKRDLFQSVQKGKEYIVLGFMVDKNDKKLSYLISDVGGGLDWVLSEYFNIVDNEILPDWHIKIYDKNNDLCDLFWLSGFDELCNNDDYFDALAEREKWALDVYFKKYDEAIEWYKVKPFMTKKTSLW